jgi:predicted esterase
MPTRLGNTGAIPFLVSVIACATPRTTTSAPDDRVVPTSATSKAPPTEALAAASTRATPISGDAALVTSAPLARAWPESGKRILLAVPAGTAEAWSPVQPPAEGGAPVSVYFHGITASAQLECPVAWGAMQQGWVVCADGNLPYGGGFTWNNPGSKTRVDAAIAALTAEHKDLVANQRGLIIGYSIGAMPAWYLLEHSSEPWTGLVFINAEFGVNPKVVKDRGLKRVALVATRGDMSSGQMSSTARSLARQGIEARFFTFDSRNGHFFDDETWKKMMVPLQWALGGNEGN